MKFLSILKYILPIFVVFRLFEFIFLMSQIIARLLLPRLLDNYIILRIKVPAYKLDGNFISTIISFRLDFISFGKDDI